jgi:DNA-binding SARP family transcriptional activator
VSALEIRMFGTLSLMRDGQPVSRFPSKRVKDLLSYLLLNRDDSHQRERLAGLFWGDLDDHKARHCLNTSLWRLHQVLAHPKNAPHPYLRVDAQTIGFNTASGFVLDVAEFETRCAWGDEAGNRSPDQQAEFYRQAIAYYTTDLLVDCYDDWCLVERERLQRLYLRALGCLLSYHAKRGSYDAAIEYAVQILAHDPLHEDVHRDLIQLYLDARQPAAALRQYRACNAVLQRELGVDPMPETQALLARIMGPSGVQVTSERPAAGAPAPLTDEFQAAVSMLREAFVLIEGAHEQLRDARTMVEHVTHMLESVPTSPSTGLPIGTGIGMGEGDGTIESSRTHYPTGVL